MTSTDNTSKKAILKKALAKAKITQLESLVLIMEIFEEANKEQS